MPLGTLLCSPKEYEKRLVTELVAKLEPENELFNCPKTIRLWIYYDIAPLYRQVVAFRLVFHPYQLVFFSTPYRMLALREAKGRTSTLARRRVHHLLYR